MQENKPTLQAPGTSTRLGELLDAHEIKQLTSIPALRPVLDIAATWAWVLGSLALAAFYPHWLVYTISFIVIASRQLAMTHLVHDASHYRLFPSRRANDMLCDLFAAGPVLISTESYRVQHLPHHQHLGDHLKDSDQRTWYNVKGAHFWRRSLLTLIGWEAVQTFGSYMQASNSVAGKQAGGGDLAWRLACAALGNGLILAWCVGLGEPWLYVWLWFLPMFTLTMYLLILRVVAEHQTLDYARQGEDRADQDFDAPLVRTISGGLIGRFLLGPMNFNYHHEHHLAPGIPYANLPQLHRRLKELGYYDDKPEALEPSYLSALRKLVFPPARPSAECLTQQT
ncbi:MAG: fatty acid desaturase family protein [Pseudomonadota bacterium]